MPPPHDQPPLDERAYRRAARLLAQKLGMDWRELPREQIEAYARKIAIGREARKKSAQKSEGAE